MVQELLPLLPKELGTLALVLAIVGAIAGIALWLVGARFSRSLITLLLVSAGGWIGLFIPRWFNLPVDGWAPALGLALILGASGFFIHRFWVGVGLGIVLAGWAAVLTWIGCKAGDTWSWPTVDWHTQPKEYLLSVWQNFPSDVQHIIPAASGTAAFIGLLTALIWMRIASVILYSLAGVSLIVGLGLCAVNLQRPDWLGMLPASTLSQGITLLGMVAFGALVQWRVAPDKKPKQRTKPMPMETY
jgi:hypothetical protein